MRLGFDLPPVTAMKDRFIRCALLADPCFKWVVAVDQVLHHLHRQLFVLSQQADHHFKFRLGFLRIFLVACHLDATAAGGNGDRREGFPKQIQLFVVFTVQLDEVDTFHS